MCPGAAAGSARRCTSTPPAYTLATPPASVALDADGASAHVPRTSAPLFIRLCENHWNARRRSSVVEQRFRKPPVGSSSLPVGSEKSGFLTHKLGRLTPVLTPTSARRRSAENLHRGFDFPPSPQKPMSSRIPDS